MEIILNPKYKQLHDYLTHLEEHFERDGKVLQSGFNEIRALDVQGLRLSVKRYGRPSLSRRIHFYRTAKGKKAYIGQRLMRERGYESPEPVAFVRVRQNLLHSRTYFIYLRSPYRYTFESLGTLPAAEREEVLQQFGRFLGRFHEDGFRHSNLKSKHVLFDKIDDRYRFCLLDANRVSRSRSVNLEKGCANFARLTGDEAFFRSLAAAYATERKADAETCFRLMTEARRKYLAGNPR